MKRFSIFKFKGNKQKRRGKVSTSPQIVRGDEHPNSTLSPSIIINHLSSSESFTEHQKNGDKYISIYEVSGATTTPSHPLQRSIDSNSSQTSISFNSSSDDSICSNDSTGTNDPGVCDAMNAVTTYFCTGDHCTSSLPNVKQSVQLKQN